MFWKHKEQFLYGGLMDISSSNVSIAIVESCKEKPFPRIIYTENIPLRFKGNMFSSEDMRAVTEAVYTAGTTLLNEGTKALRAHAPKASLSRFSISCGAPWSRTVSRTIEVREEKPFKITKPFFQELVANAEKKIKEEHQVLAIAQSLGLEVVEHTVIQTMVNGYTVQDPVGHTGVSLALKHISTLVPAAITTTISSFESKGVDIDMVSVHSSLFTYYSALGELYPSLDNLIILDVTGEATEVALVENDAFISATFIPQGVETIARNLGNASNIPFASAVSELKAYGSRTLSEAGCVAIKPHLDTYKEACAKVFSVLESTNVLPKAVIVLSGSEDGGILGREAVEALSSVTKMDHTVTFLGGREMKDITLGIPEAGIALGAQFFHKIHRSSLWS